MTVPLIVLALLSIGGGWVGLPEGWLWGPAIGRFLAPVTGHPHLEHHGIVGEGTLMIVATGMAALGAGLAWLFYVRRPELPARLAARLQGLYALLAGKYWIDEIYDALIVRPYVRFSGMLWRVIDQGLIDGAVNGTAAFVVVNGQLWRLAQTGNVQHYALVFLGGAAAVLLYYVMR
jgi:NADH-quinone oxidoreductase subunit L